MVITLLLTLAGCGSYEFRGRPITPPLPAHDFTLTDHNGQPFQLQQHTGKVVVLFFGFTNCPDICPTALADLAQAREKLGAQANQVQVVFITVDPERDTSQVIKDYLAHFDPSFLGLYGTPEELEPVIKAYGVYALTSTPTPAPEAANGHEHHSEGLVEHSGYIYIIDKQGRWRELFSSGNSPTDIAADLEHLISE